MEIQTYETLVKEYGTYDVVPIYQEHVADEITPITMIQRIRSLSHDHFLLESVKNSEWTGRYSFLGMNPRIRIYAKNEALVIEKENETVVQKGNPIQLAKEFLKSFRAPKLEKLPTFLGGFVGYFSYEMIQLAEPKLKLKDTEYPLFDLSLYDKVFAFDHRKHTVYTIVNVNMKLGKTAYDQAVTELKNMTEMLGYDTRKKENTVTETPKFQCNVSKAEYFRMVEVAKKHIFEGDIFQGVISRSFEAEYHSSLLNPYRMMRTLNPSPYMYYIHSKDVEIAGVSPETMVKLVDGTLYTYPIAGTRKRGETVEEDNQLETELLEDEKELAEHNMLVDLARNDIGRISEFGSVKIKEYLNVQKFSKVMHLVSSVSGQLKEGLSAWDVLISMLPAGTLSGAPKFRACEIINEIEPTSRGIYGGAIGYIDFSGNLDVCIAIRTAVKKDSKVFVQAGAGIVADSNPEKEYEECENKAKAVLESILRAGEVNKR